MTQQVPISDQYSSPSSVFFHFEWIVSTVQLNQVTSSFSAFTIDLTMESLLRADNLKLGESVKVLTLVQLDEVW